MHGGAARCARLAPPLAPWRDEATYSTVGGLRLLTGRPVKAESNVSRGKAQCCIAKRKRL